MREETRVGRGVGDAERPRAGRGDRAAVALDSALDAGGRRVTAAACCDVPRRRVAVRLRVTKRLWRGVTSRSGVVVNCGVEISMR